MPDNLRKSYRKRPTLNVQRSTVGERAQISSKLAFIPTRLSENRRLMQEIPPNALTPFVFSDPAGKRWPRLRLALLIFGVLAFLGTVLFVQTLFVAPKMRVPFSLRQLKGQLKALQKANPAGPAASSSLLWQKFGEAKQAANKLAGAPPPSAPAAKPRKKAPPNEVRLAFYTN